MVSAGQRLPEKAARVKYNRRSFALFKDDIAHLSLRPVVFMSLVPQSLCPLVPVFPVPAFQFLK